MPMLLSIIVSYAPVMSKIRPSRRTGYYNMSKTTYSTVSFLIVTVLTLLMHLGQEEDTTC